MRIRKVKVSIYQKHSKVRVFWSVAQKKNELSPLDQQYESVTLIAIYQSQKTREFSMASMRILQSHKKKCGRCSP